MEPTRTTDDPRFELSASADRDAVLTPSRLIQAIVFLVGILLGGGGAGAIGAYQYAELQQEVNSFEEKILDRIQRMDDSQRGRLTQIDQRLSRLEGQMESASRRSP